MDGRAGAVEDLREGVLACIEYVHMPLAKRFRWTDTGRPLMVETDDRFLPRCIIVEPGKTTCEERHDET